MNEQASQKRTTSLFPATSWSLVELASDPSNPEARRESLGTLLSVYRPLLVRYLSGRRGCDMAAAEDVVQQFIADKILEGELLRKADRARGRLRHLLAIALDRFFLSKRRSDLARVDVRADGADLTDNLTDDSQLSLPSREVVDRQWAREVIFLALARMQVYLRETGRPEAWSLFRDRVVTPALEGGGKESLSKLAALFQAGTESRASNLIVTSRRIFAREILAVMQDLGEIGEPDEMVADLLSCAARAD